MRYPNMKYQTGMICKKMFLVSAVFVIGSLSATTPFAFADSEAGRLALVNGDVRIAKGDADAGKTAKPNDPIQNADVIKTGANASAKMLFSDQSVMDIGPSS